MNRNDIIKFLCFVIGLQLLFAALHYVGGYTVSPAIVGGTTAGILTMYLARRRKSA